MREVRIRVHKINLSPFLPSPFLPKIDYRHLDQKSVSEAIDAMVKADPNLAWIKDAEARGDVDWRAVHGKGDRFIFLL